MSDIYAQSYQYFLAEAQDLLQSIETDLFNLTQEQSKATIHNLMRATHTLKGASANVRQQTIQKLSHSLEDVFRALLTPEATITPEVEALLFEGYECLRLALSAELTSEQIDESEVLNRAAAVFAGLQEELGDYFNNQAPLPTSAELGFDITKSIFEVGVQQRLDELSSLVANYQASPTNLQQLAQATAQHAEVFLGLAESLNLPGFQLIAECTLGALEAHPAQAFEIAQLALADFQKGHGAVIAGDRTSGGQPSEQLQQLTGMLGEEPSTPNQQEVTLEAQDLSALPDLEETFGNIDFLPDTSSPQFEEIPDFDQPDLEETFGDIELPTDTPVLNSLELTSEELDIDLPLVTKSEYQDSEQTQQSPPAPHRKSAPPKSLPSPSVRVQLEQLKQLNQLVSELQINHNQLTLRDEQFQGAVRKLSIWLQQHRQTIIQLRDEISQHYLQELREGMGNHPLDILLHAALEETVQIEQAKEDINFLADHSSQAVEREEQLLKRLRDDLQSVRLVSLESLFNRFPPMIQQLSIAKNKFVELKVSGTEVMVDKAITENLYDALLHLVRNAFDHGIEPAEIRQQQNKPSTGQIKLHAFNQGNRTVIELSDDGRGLDVEKIYNRALELDLLTSAQIASIKQAPEPVNRLLEVLCKPGFSTASQVSDLSGRGIGLDVVASQLQKFKGILKVKSQPHQGTTFLIQIPSSLISARLMIVQAQGRTYGFISHEIEQVYIPQPNQIKSLGDKKILEWQRKGQSHINIYQLSSLLSYGTTTTDWRQTLPIFTSTKAAFNSLLIAKQEAVPLLLIRTNQGLVGLEIDRVIEEQELAIKPIPEILQPPPYVYGCTILADSSLTLVIDAATLINYQHQIKASGTRGAQGNFSDSEEVSEQSGSSSQTFLVIDDSITERHTLAQIIQRTGNQVLQARDGIEALEQLRQHPEVNLVICDLEMPRMNGFEFLSSTARDPAMANIPVVMLTSRSNQNYRQIAQELGAAAYLTKPYLEQELLATMGEVLSR